MEVGPGGREEVGSLGILSPPLLPLHLSFFLLFVYFILSKSLFGSTVPEGKFIMTEKT